MLCNFDLVVIVRNWIEERSDRWGPLIILEDGTEINWAQAVQVIRHGDNWRTEPIVWDSVAIKIMKEWDDDAPALKFKPKD